MGHREKGDTCRETGNEILASRANGRGARGYNGYNDRYGSKGKNNN